MCDCFHAVLPWPGAPGSVSGQQLEPQEPETEEEHSVTAGPVDEVIRPRPQGSSPVYECRTEGTSFGLQEDAPGRRGASGRRRSWWKRDSGDSQTLSRMSRPEEATEVTLETEVEAGASGYSVTGGGHQGIFVKQVLRDSSAAKLFNLQAGDQLLSATVFFDEIKYEDALKILQYSEPYRVQFKLRRRLPAADAGGRGSSGSQRLPAGEEKQDKDIADGCPETPTKTLEGDGDQERLISQAREGRGRRPQKERRSWPKFQALKSTRGTGPRRSHSSSEASERRDAPDVSPGITDTEAQAPAEHLRQKAGPGPQETREFLSLRLRMGLGQEPPGRGDTGAAAGGGGERGVTLAPGARPVLSTPRPTEPGLPSLAEGEGSQSEGPGVGPKPQSGAGAVETQQEARTQAEGKGEAVQGLVSGTVRGPLQGTAQGGGAQSHPPEIHVRIPHLKMPKFGFRQEKELERDRGAPALQLAWGPSPAACGEGAGEAGVCPPGQDQGGPGPARAEPGGGEDLGGGKGAVRTPEGKAPPGREREGESGLTGVTGRTEVAPEGEGRRHRTEDEPRSVSGTEGRAAAESLALALGDRDVAPQGELQVPPFRLSAPGKTGQALVGPRLDADVTLPVFQGHLETRHLSIQLPSADLDVQQGQVDVTHPERQRPEAELREPQASAAGLRGRLPQIQMPGVKMPRVEPQGPQADIKGPKMDVTGAEGDMEVSQPSKDVDIQACGGKLETDLVLGDKDLASKGSKFKMPKFKMPSFGTSTPRKTVEVSVDKTMPVVGADVTLPSFQGDLESGDLSTQLPSADLDIQSVQGDTSHPEDQLSGVEVSEAQVAGTRLKGHLPRVQTPSIKMPKVGLRGPQVDIKGPDMDVKSTKGTVSTTAVEVSLPSIDADAQAPGAKVGPGLAMGDKEVTVKDSKFRMPKFKMPSFGASTPRKTVQASVDVPTSTVEAAVTLVSFQGDLKTTGLSIQLPPEPGVQPAQGDVRLPEAQLPDMELSVPQASAAGPRGHLPKVPMPSIRMPKVGLQGPQVDIGAPKVDVKGSMGEVSTPDLGESLPSVDVDMQAPSAQLEADLDLGEKAVAAKDSKFRLPRFRMPSFGTSTTGKTTEAPLDVTTPKVEADLTLPSFQGDVKTPDLSVQLPSADVKVQPVQLGGKVPEGQQPEAELPTPQASAAGPRGQLPKVPMPSIRMPKVGLQGPQVDIGAPKVDVKGSMGEVSAPDLGESLPSVDVDMQAPGAQLEMDPSLGHQDVSIKDSKFKMPSFVTSAPGKTVEALLDKTVLMVEADLTRPSLQGDLETTDLSIQRPSSHPETQPGQVSVRLPEGPQPETELPPPQASEAGLKGHVPNAPSITGAQVDIRSPSEVAQCAKAEVGAPGMQVSLPCTDLGIRAPGVEGTSLGDKEVTVKDSKFRTPKLQMPSSGASTPGKTEEASVGVPTSAAETAVALPPHCGDLRSIELGSRLPSADQEVQPGQLCVQPPEGQPPGTELSEPQPQASGLRGHLPGAQMPSIKVPRVDLKGPQVAITGLEVDMKGAKEEVSTPDLEASLPSTDVAIQAPGVKVETDLALGRPFPPPPSSSRGPVSSSTLEGSLEHIAAAPSAARSPGAGAALPEARVPVQAETQALGSAAQDSSERLPGPGHSPFPLVPPSASATSSVVRTAQAPGQVPQVALPSAPSASVDVTGGHVSTSCGHVRLTEHQVALPPATLAPPPPQDAAFGSQVSAPPSSVGSSAAPQCPGRVPTSQTAGPLPAAHGWVTFPKFHKPKFGFSSPKATVPEVDLRAEVRAPALPAGDPTGAVGGVAGEGGPSSPPGSELRSSGVSARAPKGAPSEAPDQEGKGSPFRAPGWTLPSQSRALEQDRGPTGDPEGSWEDTDAQPRGPGSHADTHGHRPPEAQGEKSRRGLPTARASEGQAAAALPSPAAKGGVGATERASSAGGGSSSGASGGGAVSRRLPQARFPSLGFVKLDRRSSKATAEVSRAEAKPRLPAHTAAAGSGSGGPGPTEEGTAPPGEDLPQPPCGKPGAGLPGEDAPAEATPVSAQESRFKMPKLHVPGFRRTRSKDRGEAAEQEAPGGAGSPLSGPEAQAGAAPQPPDTKAGAAAASEGVSSVGVPQCPPHSTGVMLSEISTQPAEGSLPLQGLGTRPSGRQAEAPVESWPSPPQGPVRLTASRTDVPAQVSVVSTHQLWQDSVLTVKFPTWKGPRFAFPAPGSEADVFVPAVRQVRGSVAGAGEALSEGRAGLWAASILPAATEVFGEQPVCLDPSWGPPPISQVRVHFQRAPAESQGMVLRSGASPAPADPVETEAISTEIVRESEIPTSRVQTPSYGFSLLKVKLPERRARAVCTVPGGSEAPAAGGSVSGPVPPDSAEPFEAVPSGGHPLGPAEDEEPAAEEDREAAEAGAAPQKPGSQKSGLWFWLPHVGFSSSVDETSAAPGDPSQSPAPVQTQPEARPAAQPPGRQEKASWFRFPKLGFSAPPAKSSPGVGAEGGAGPSEPTGQDETVAFFDARESLSPEEKEGGDPAEAAGAGQKEPTKNAGREPAPPAQGGPEKGEA